MSLSTGALVLLHWCFRVAQTLFVAPAANAQTSFEAHASFAAVEPEGLPPAIGSVFALYGSAASGRAATLVEAPSSSFQAVNFDEDQVEEPGGAALPRPSCPLQLKSQTQYPSKWRKANLRMAEIAVCNYWWQLFGAKSFPSCERVNQVRQTCQLSLDVPLPHSDELQEPHLGASIAVAAFSRLCALKYQGSFEKKRCEVHHRSAVAITGGFQLEANGDAVLKGLSCPGVVDMKMNDATALGFGHVLLPLANQPDLAATSPNNPTATTGNQALPIFCKDLPCLAKNLIPIASGVL